MKVAQSHYSILLALICWMFAICGVSSAQIIIQPKLLDYGTTSSDTDWVRDIIITNKSDKKDYLLRHTFNRDFDVLFTSKTLQPDSSIVMRLKFSPNNKGTYRQQYALYFASLQEPLWITVVAEVDQKNNLGNVPCPDFSRLAADCCVNNMSLIEVRDSISQLPLGNAGIIIREQGSIRKKLISGKDGKVSFEIPISYYTIEASAEGYIGKSVSTYINHRKNNFKILLSPDPNYTPLPVAVTNDETLAEAADQVDFSELLYKPNNIVFLLDISGSMLQSNKLPLLKASVLELAGILRPIDKISIVTYSEKADVLLPTTIGSNKGDVESKVESVKISGNTNAPLGFKAALQIAEQQIIAGGNNQLYVITDGAFGPKDQKPILKMIKKHQRKGISTSIIGIKSTPFAQNNLQMVAENGNGSFLQIDSEADLSHIIEELKKRSIK